MRAALYCRLSEEDRGKLSREDDSGSIRNQKAMLTRYAAEHGWEIAGVYSDDDYAGADRRRPAFNRLLRDAEAHLFDVVLCKTQSRFTRELELVEKYIHGLFPLWGIRFVSIVDHADTENRGNKKSRQINGLVNEWYLEDMSENIRSVLTSRRQSGCHIGAFALYGYRKDPERRGGLLIDEGAAAVVREVFARFAGGEGKTAIARRLNERGVPNPTEYKRLQGLHFTPPGRRNSTRWSYSAIAAMLKNEMYAGVMVQGKYGSVSYKTRQNRPRPRDSWYRVENTHEAIIPPALWTQVQALLAARAKPFGSGERGLFAGKACCAACGYALRSTRSKGRQYLKCPTRHVARDACCGAFISVKRLEDMVLAELTRLTACWLDREAALSGIRLSETPDPHAALSERLGHLRQQEEEYAAGLREMYLDRARGVITAQEHADMAAAFSQERSRLQAQIAKHEAQLQHLTPAPTEQERREALLARYMAPDALTHDMVDVMIDRILVGQRIPGSREVPVEIRWRC